jgi:hypothetical protein
MPVTSILSTPNVMACWKKEIEEAKRESKKQAAIEDETRIKREKEEQAARLAEIESAKERDRQEYEANKRKLEAEEKIKAAEEIRLNERAKQEEDIAAMKKQKAVARLAGHYEIKQGASKHKSTTFPRTIDVQVMSDDKIKFSLHNKSQQGSLVASCDIDNQEADLEYSGKGNHIEAIFGNQEYARRNKDGCFISLKFKESSADVIERMGYDFSVEVDQDGRCKSYCGRAGTMMGRYIKTSN